MKRVLSLLVLAATVSFAQPMLSPEVSAMVTEAKKEVNSINAENLSKQIDEGKIVVIDVRDPNEWEQGTIKSDKLIKLSRGFLEVKYPKAILEKYSKDDNFVVYCGIEPRSVLAAQTMKKLGFKNVSYLEAGFKSWEAKGLPISK